MLCEIFKGKLGNYVHVHCTSHAGADAGFV